VVQALGAGPVPPDFVPGPALPEGIAAGGQLADQVRQRLVVGVAPDLGAQGGDVLVGDGIPVGVELAGGGVQEGEAGGVDRAGRAGEDRRERIAENFDVFDFELTTAELKALDGLDTGTRSGPEPDDITLEAYGRAIPEA
jgi:hypothetical protein